MKKVFRKRLALVLALFMTLTCAVPSYSDVVHAIGETRSTTDFFGGIPSQGSQPMTDRDADLDIDSIKTTNAETKESTVSPELYLDQTLEMQPGSVMVDSTTQVLDPQQVEAIEPNNWQFQQGDTEVVSEGVELSVTTITETTVDLSWTKADRAVVYEVYCNEISVAVTPHTSESITGLCPGLDYAFLLKVLDVEGNVLSTSNELKISTKLIPPDDYNGDSSLVDVYQVGASNVEVFNYVYDISSPDVEANSATNLDETENPPTQSDFFNDMNNNPDAELVKKEIFSLSSFIEDVQAPTIPEDLVVSAKTANTVTLGWTLSTDNVQVEGYEIYRDGLLVGTTANNYFTDAPLRNNISYTYTLKAFDTSGNRSGLSEGIIVVTDVIYGDFIQVSSGEEHVLALKNDGTVWAWGYGGSLGDGTFRTRLLPVPVKGLRDVQSISAGLYHSMALKQDGTVWTWGENRYGALGDGTTTHGKNPNPIEGMTEIAAIAGGGYHSLALKSDGTVWAWGDNSYGQLGDRTTIDRLNPVQVQGLNGIIAIAAGNYHSIALKEDGSLWLWGANWDGQLGDGTTINRPVPVRLENFSDVISLGAGAEHTIVLKNDGSVWAWGYNGFGQLGDSSNINRYSPVPIEELRDVSAIEAGYNHSLVVKSNGTVMAVGDNYSGQLGDNTTVQRNTFGTVSGLEGVLAVDGGYGHSVALVTDGSILAWGRNRYGQLGDGTQTSSYIPVISAGEDTETPSTPKGLWARSFESSVTLSWNESEDNTWVDGYLVYRDGQKVGIAAGTSYNDYQISPGRTYTYTVRAYDGAGNLSEHSEAVINDTEAPTTPANLSVADVRSVTVKLSWEASTDNVAVGGYEIYRDGVKVGTATTETVFLDKGLTPHTTYNYFIKAFDTGLNLSEASNTVTVETTLEAVPPYLVPLTAGGYTTMVIKETGTVWGWGYNCYGQIGDGTTVNRQVPVLVQIDDVAGLAGGLYYSIALKHDGTVWTWGANHLGQLGNELKAEYTLTPMKVEGLTGATLVEAGGFHSLALIDGYVWTWGSNYYGQLGDGTTQRRDVPVAVSGLTDVIHVVGGSSHSLALRSDGTVWAWGSNSYGQLGDGTQTQRPTPVQVSGLTDIVAISVGSNHSLALKGDGTVWVWGWNSFGQLGDGTRTWKANPIQVQGLTDVIAIAGGAYHSAAVKSDGTVWTWGHNLDGQLGDGSTLTRLFPVQVPGLNDVVHIKAGHGHTVVLKSDGTVWGWGANNYGQLGNGFRHNRPFPVEAAGDTQPPSVPGNLVARSVETAVILTWSAATDNVGVAGYKVFRDGLELATVEGTTYTDLEVVPGNTYSYTVKAFDKAGLLSAPSNEAQSDWQAPSVPEDFTLIEKKSTFISLGWSPSTDNSWVAGYEIYRDGVKIGTSTVNSYKDIWLIPGTTYTYSVKAYDAGFNYSEESERLVVTTDPLGELITTTLACGYEYSLSIRHGNTLWAWGNNDKGQLGDGTLNPRTSPGQVREIQGVVSVAAGYKHTLALKSDSTVWAWGNNEYGQLGNKSTNSVYYPIKTELTGVTALTAGMHHSVAVSDGFVWTWGYNNWGQLGDGTTVNRAKPVLVPGLTDVIQVAAGNLHTVALKSDGSVWAWGYNASGQLGIGSTVNNSSPVQVPGLSDVIAIAAHGHFTLVLKSDGTVWAWGNNGHGQLGDGTWSTRTTPVQVQGLTDIKYIGCGEYYSFAKDANGNLWGWGWGWQFGTSLNRPSQIVELSDVDVVVGGWSHSLAKKKDGTDWAWGGNYYGQLGDGTTNYSVIPVLAAGDTVPPMAPTGLVVQATETAVLLTWNPATDNVAVVGYKIYRNGVEIGTTTGISYNDAGLSPELTYVYTVRAYDAVGNISLESASAVRDYQAPEAPIDLTVISKMSARVTLTWTAPSDNIGVTGYEVYRDGVKVASVAEPTFTDTLLTPGTTYAYVVRAYDAGLNLSDESNVVTVATDSLIITGNAIAGGMYHTISRSAEDNLLSWGRNQYGQLGDGSTTNRIIPVEVLDLTSMAVVAAGEAHTVALGNDGLVRTWGYNGLGQIGGENISGKITPYLIQNLTGVSAVTAGHNHTAALSDGMVWTWGRNEDGQLGDGTKVNKSSPVQVPGLTGVVAISNGANHTVVLKGDGTVWAWGDNNYGQLGDGTSVDRYSPVQVQGLSGIVAISGGSYHTVALKNDGTVWAWGYNFYGQLGTNSQTSRNTPVQTHDLTGVTAIAAGGYHTLALKSDGTVWAWGYNNRGQLGDGTTAHKYKPVQSQVLNEVVNIAAGNTHSIALKNDGSVWTWGDNGYGQLGDGTTTNRSIPVIASGDTQPPTVPTGLKAVSTETDCLLTWNPSTDNVGVTGYRVYRNGEEIGATTGTSYTDTGLQPSQEYQYYVRAYDACGNLSNSSNSVVRDYLAPTVPTGLAVTEVTASTVSLNWIESTDNVGVTGYEIYRNGIKAGTSAETNYTDTGLQPTVVYSYTVKAFDAGQNLSELSESVVAITTEDTVAPTPPTGLWFKFNSATWITLYWTASTDNVGVVGYEVYRDGLKLGSITETSYFENIYNIVPGTTYLYTVYAYDESGNSSSSSINFFDDHGNGVGNATPVQVGINTPGVIDYSSDWDYFSFTATANAIYVIQSHSDIDTYGYLYDSSGKQITYNNDAGVGRNFKITSGLTAGNTYFVAVRHNSSSGMGAYTLSIYAEETEPPTAPENLTVTGTSLTTISLSWTASTDNVGVTGYELFRNGTKLRNVYSTDCTDTGLNPGTAYTYSVRAFDSAGNKSIMSNEVVGVTTEDNQSPTIPTNLRITAATDTSISFAWDASVDNAWVAGYEVYRNGIKIGTTNFTNYTNYGLTPNVHYVYTVRAYDISGNFSEHSDSITNDFEAPSTPSNLIVTAITASTISFVWPVSTDNVAVIGYEVFRDNVKVGVSSDTSYTDTGLLPGWSYTYTVKAYDLAGNRSRASEPLVVITESDTQAPTAPTNLGITSKSPTSVTLAWTASSDNVGVTGYKVYREGTEIGTTNSLFYTDLNLPHEVGYLYTVRAFDGAGNLSGLSNSVIYDNKAPDPPTDLSIVSINDISVTFFWTAATDNVGVTGYEVYRNGIRIALVGDTSYADSSLVPYTICLYCKSF